MTVDIGELNQQLTVLALVHCPNINKLDYCQNFVVSKIFERKKIPFALQGCIYLTKTTLKTVILWNIFTI